MKILIVCLGNICRSPIAEGVLQHLALQHKLNWKIESAGTNKIHTGEAPHKLSQQVCLEKGIDISTQCSMDFVPSDFETYDKLYVMAADVMHDVKKIAGSHFDETKIDYFLNELYPCENQSVIDPWYGGLDGYYDVYNQIEACCKKIVEKYA
jgi:protein-tyrosine phosphatase